VGPCRAQVCGKTPEIAGARRLPRARSNGARSSMDQCRWSRKGRSVAKKLVDCACSHNRLREDVLS
jgi:hypothetical protein